MTLTNIISLFSRFSLSNSKTAVVPLRTISLNSTLLLKLTPCLMAEPLKKKKKMDPAVLRAREERKKKKIEKQIRRLEKNARQLKPIDECEIPLSLLDEREKRMRKIQVNQTILENRAQVFHAWSNYKREQHMADMQMIDRIIYSQQRALDELRIESEELYQEAIQLEPMLLPLNLTGPTETPPKQDYEAPDGEYQDISKKWN